MAFQPIPILLVDDKPANLVALEAVLACSDYLLVKAGSGKEALGRLADHEYAVILLDIQMPEMDGYQTARFIRAHPRFKQVPIIFVTAVYADLDHIELGYEAGAVDYIIKPFDPNILRSKVGVFADLHRKSLEIQEQGKKLIHEAEQRAKAEASREYFRQLVDWLDHSIVWEAEAPEMSYIFVSRKSSVLLGYPHELWFQQKNFFIEHVHPDDRDLVQKTFEKAWNERTDERCEHRMVTATGEIQWFHTGVQVETGADHRGKPRYRGLTVDISPLKAVEEELRRRERKCRQVIDANLLGHIYADLHGQITDANDHFFQMVGFTREDLLAGKMRWDHLIPPKQRLVDEKATEELKRSGICTPYETEYFRKDGTQIPVMVGKALIEESADQYVCFVLNLADRKKAEQERARAIRDREEMLEIVSHDLKNPLGAILMSADMLDVQVSLTPETHSLRERIQGIHRSATRMKNLIEDLLDAAKIESGRLPIQKNRQGALEVVNEVIQMLEPMASAKAIRIEKDLPEIDPEIACDRERIVQVLSNLVGNAIKFTGEFGSVRVGVSLDGSEVIFWVEDSGVGISNDDLPRVFDRYWQARSAKKAGSGLGLFIAKGIIDAHGGRIWAESAPGKGSTFYFALSSQPRAPEIAPGLSSKGFAAHLPRKKSHSPG